jgi:hypothetical protein
MRLFSSVKCVAFVLGGAMVASAAWAQEPHEHDMLIGSSASGGGQLKIEWDWDEIFVTPIGSAGGITFHTATDPGFDALDHDDPGDIYELLSGTDVSFRITSIDPGVSITIRGNTLNTIGQTALIGTKGGSPSLHHHPTWALALPDGVLDDRSISFELFTSATAYSTSQQYTAVLTNIPEPAAVGLLALGIPALLRRRRMA